MNSKMQISVLLFLIASALEANAQIATYSAEEMKVFMELRNKHVQASVDGNVEALRSVAKGFNQLLHDYPHTINRKDILVMLFEARAALHVQCDTLIDLAQKVIVMESTHYNFHMISKGYLENDCDLESAQDAAEKALGLLAQTSSLHKPLYYQTLGKIQSKRGLYTKAIESFRKGVWLIDSGAVEQREQVNVDNELRVSIKRDLAQTYLLANQEKEALALFKSLYAEYPNNDALQGEYVQALIRTGSNEKQAIDLTEQVREEAYHRLKAGAALNKLNQKGKPFRLASVQGDTLTFADLVGKVSLLNFWAKWCAPCLAEMPFLVELHKSYHDRPFQVLAINLPDSGTPMFENVIKEYGIDFPILIGNKQIEKDYRVPPVPLTLIFDKSGTLQYKHLGYDENSIIKEQIKIEIEYLLNEAKETGDNK